MFFCRHQLLRAFAQRHFVTLLTARHAPRSASSTGLSARHRYARLSSSLPYPESASGQAPTTTNEPDADISTTNEVPDTETVDITAPPEPLKTAERVSPQQLRECTEQELMELFKEKPTSKYLALREEVTIHALSKIPTTLFKYIALDAARMGKVEAREALVHDAVEMCRLKTRRYRYPALFLLRLFGARRIIPKLLVLNLMRALRDNDHLRHCDYADRLKVASFIMTYDFNAELDGELMDIFTGWLIEKLPPDHLDRPNLEWKGGLWETTQTGKVPLITWPLFRITLTYARLGEQAKASVIMSKLARGRRFDPHAINATDLNEKDYLYVVLSVIVQSLLRFGWFQRATQLLVPVVTSRQELSVPMAQLVEDWLAAALTFPRAEDLTEAGGMITLLFQRARDFTLSHRILQRFYEEAARSDRGELAQNVYRRSREVEGRSYPPPKGHALEWLVQYLRRQRRDVHLFRVLTQQIIDEDSPVEPPTRAGIIYAAADMGNTMHARALWERWSVGPDGQYVVARTGTMLRVVSAFVNTEVATVRQAMNRLPTEPDPSRENLPEGPYDRPDDQEGDVPATAPQGGPEDDPEDHPRADAPQLPPPPHEDKDAGAKGAFSPSGVLILRAPWETGGYSEEHGPPQLSREALLERARDVRAFAERVYEACYASKVPLERADQRSLNALARGAFMLERDGAAFEIFGLMRKRGMKMDMHDLNVVIAVMSKADPAGGLQRVQKMIDSGIQPDAVTYGTVIYWAIYHGDAPLVMRTIEMAHAHGLENFSFKTLAALLHAAVLPDFESETPASDHLKNVESIVGTMLDMGITPTPNVGRDCVRAALNAEDPVMAFEFWKELMKDKVEWADAGQMRVRRTVADQICEHFSAGWLDEARALVMLNALGFSSFDRDVRRVLASQRFDGFGG